MKYWGEGGDVKMSKVAIVLTTQLRMEEHPSSSRKVQFSGAKPDCSCIIHASSVQKINKWRGVFIIRKRGNLLMMPLNDRPGRAR